MPTSRARLASGIDTGSDIKAAAPTQGAVIRRGPESVAAESPVRRAGDQVSRDSRLCCPHTSCPRASSRRSGVHFLNSGLRGSSLGTTARPRRQQRPYYGSRYIGLPRGKASANSGQRHRNSLARAGEPKLALGSRAGAAVRRPAGADSIKVASLFAGRPRKGGWWWPAFVGPPSRITPTPRGWCIGG